MAASPRKSDGSAIHPYPPFFEGRCRAIRSGSRNGFRGRLGCGAGCGRKIFDFPLRRSDLVDSLLFWLIRSAFLGNWFGVVSEQCYATLVASADQLASTNLKTCKQT
jgi:hypothetical protein